MTRVATVRKADLDRVIRALKDAGQMVGRVEIRPGGIVEITPALTGVAPEPLTPLEQFRVDRARRNGERAA